MKSAVTHRFHCAPGTGLCSQSWRVSWPSCCGSCSVVWRVLTAWTLLRLKPGGGSTRATTSGRTAWLGTAGAGVSAEDITKSVYRKKSRLQYRVKGWFLNIFRFVWEDVILIGLALGLRTNFLLVAYCCKAKGFWPGFVWNLQQGRSRRSWHLLFGFVYFV